MSYGITEVETRAFEMLKPWLIENHGTIDMNQIQNNGQLVRAEKKAIMAIMLSLDANEFIFDYWSFGTFIRIILERLLDFGRLMLDSQETGQILLGSDMFSGEAHDASTEALVPAFAVTETGEKKEYLGSMNAWAYHIILNGPSHPATREPIRHFGLKSLEDFKVLPKALRLSRSERLSLAGALKTERPPGPQISSHQVLAFELEYSVPEDRSFYEFHHEQMPPLMHAVPQDGAFLVNAVHYLHENALMYHNLLVHNQQPMNQQMSEDVFIFEEDEA